MDDIKITFYRESFNEFIIRLDDSIIKIDNNDRVCMKVGSMVTVELRPTEDSNEKSNPSA